MRKRQKQSKSTPYNSQTNLVLDLPIEITGACGKTFFSFGQFTAFKYPTVQKVSTENNCSQLITFILETLRETVIRCKQLQFRIITL
jgi:hypothetical protein